MVGLEEIRWARSIADGLRKSPITRDRVARSMMRAVGLQVAWRVLGLKAMTVPFVNETELVLRAQMPGASGNFYRGLYDFEEMSFLLHLLGENDLFVDVGANVGTYTVLASGVRRARTIAFEPIARARASLFENLRANQIEERVAVHATALGRSAGRVQFISDMDTMNRALDGKEEYRGATEWVEIKTLDTALAGAVPTLLKIDVEGYEAEVLAGAERTLAAPSLMAIIAEFNASNMQFGSSDSAILTSLAAHGFKPQTYVPQSRQLLPPGAVRTANNLVLVRDSAELRRRLECAPKFRVLGTEL